MSIVKYFAIFVEKSVKMYKPEKVVFTCKLDADVAAWLEQGGKAYETGLNSILRQLMTHTA